MDFVEWHDGTFVPSASPPVTDPPTPDAVAWWHASTDLCGKHRQSHQGVTHLGDEDAAQHRADVQALRGMKPTGLHEIQLSTGLSVLPMAYLENHGQDAMKSFEDLLIGSPHDLAFTWNKKEVGESGGWTLIARQSVIGEIPNNPLAGISSLKTYVWHPGEFYQSVKPTQGDR